MLVITGYDAVVIRQWAEKNAVDFAWADQDGGGSPAPPRRIIANVVRFVKAGKNVATFSPHAVCKAQQMVRTHQASAADVTIVYIGQRGKKHEIHLDVRGDMIQPWPEAFDENSILDGEIRLRYP